MILMSLLAFSAGAALMAALIWLESQHITPTNDALPARCESESQHRPAAMMARWQPRRAYRHLL